MKLKSKILLSLLATSSAAFAQTVPAPAAAPAAPETTIAYNVGVVSQYRYRGLAQTKGEPAIQAGVDYTRANGAYLGVWASTIRWIKDASSSDGTTAIYKGGPEVDLYGGYKFDTNGITYDFGLLRYQYLSNNYDYKSAYSNPNTTEAYIGIGMGAYSMKYSNALTDLFGYQNTNGSTYLEVAANYDLGSGITLTPHIGRQQVSGPTKTLSYSDYSLTVAKDFGGGISGTFGYVGTNGKNNSSLLSNKTSYNTAKDAVVVGIKYTF
jgi:uncharacterized protein (TIGR02001 family)